MLSQHHVLFPKEYIDLPVAGDAYHPSDLIKKPNIRLDNNILKSRLEENPQWDHLKAIFSSYGDADYTFFDDCLGIYLKLNNKELKQLLIDIMIMKTRSICSIHKDLKFGFCLFDNESLTEELRITTPSPH